MAYIEWLRSRVGKRKILLVFSSVVLNDESGRILLQRRADNGRWGLPGGLLEPGETIIECAHRELSEETGLQAGELRLVGIYTDPRYDSVYPNGDQVQQFTVCFAGQVSGGELQIDSHVPGGSETLDLAFFAPDELPFDELPNFYQDMLRHARGDARRHALRHTLDGSQAKNGHIPVLLPPYTCPDPINIIDLLRPLIGPALYIGVGAIGVVVRQDGRILATRRSDNGEWTLPGGFMHIGENAEHTAVREVLEETGVHIALERFIGLSSQRQAWVYPNGDAVQSVIAIFRARPTGGVLQADGTETSQVSWMLPEEILALHTHPILARINQAALAHLESGVFVVC